MSKIVITDLSKFVNHWARKKLIGFQGIIFVLSDGRHFSIDDRRRPCELQPDPNEELYMHGRTTDVKHGETLFVAGDDGFVAISSDGGRNWERSNTRCRTFINSLCFYNRSLGFALSDFGILLLTADGGATWQRVKGLKRAGIMVAAHFLSDRLALIVSSFGIHRLELPEGRVL